MIPVWIKKLIASRAGGWALNAWEFIRAFWPFVAAAIMLYIAWVIIHTTNELRAIRLNQKKVKVWNKKIETSAEDDSLIVDQMRKLREHELVIIYTHNDEKVRIKRIADDSLQFWADSLYNSTK
ncbi:hypothetical protein [Lacihabitans soyangensis]|uniref:Uncharacterized protein n=1 Tax=Lacihabitans soyangensis TaxID=869394 RepID=A0AAE3H6M9_9BACT|nr:hypothetical protein [Lacihabitans soyangensis]MCP9765125.1 hypothetical protein [Lacihabitans soyangensis]